MRPTITAALGLAVAGRTGANDGTLTILAPLAGFAARASLDCALPTTLSTLFLRRARFLVDAFAPFAPFAVRLAGARVFAAVAAGLGFCGFREACLLVLARPPTLVHTGGEATGSAQPDLAVLACVGHTIGDELYHTALGGIAQIDGAFVAVVTHRTFAGAGAFGAQIIGGA